MGEGTCRVTRVQGREEGKRRHRVWGKWGMKWKECRDGAQGRGVQNLCLQLSDPDPDCDGRLKMELHLAQACLQWIHNNSICKDKGRGR